MKAFSTPEGMKIIITDDFHSIRIKVRKINSVREAISRDNLTTKWVCMFSRYAREYIIE